MTLDAVQRHRLLALARQSIEAGLQDGRRAAFPESAATADFLAPRSTFVTLRIDGALRGCCGSIEPQRALAEDLWRNAWAAAFSDPRFPGLTEDEYRDIDVHVSVLNELAPLQVAAETELLRVLRPDLDGVVLRLGASQVTFLPAVWKQLADPADFIRHLKFKAGWHADFWSPDIRVWVYAAESFGEKEDEATA